MSILTTQFNLKTDNNGIPGTIINSPLNVGDKFFVEVLMKDGDQNPIGITSSNISLSFNPNQVQNINDPFDPTSLTSPLITANFPMGRTGTLDNTNGSITNLGGGSLPAFGLGSPIGINQADPFSLSRFQVVGNNNSTITLNIDLSQTGFADGTFASNSPNQSQFSQIITINNTQSVPEPTPIVGLLLIGTFLLAKIWHTLSW